MRSATLEALGLFAHAVHLGLILLGLVGVGLLLVPGWRESRALRHGQTAWRAPATVSEHDQRVAVLRRSISSGTLTAAPAGSAVVTHVERGRDRRPDDDAPWRAFAVISTMAAAIVHVAVLPHHAVESGLLVGLFIAGAAGWQASWAWQLTRAVTVDRLRSGIAGSLALIALWAWSRTGGLPFGLTSGAERVGAWDLACELWQLCVVLACLRGLSLRRGRSGTHPDPVAPRGAKDPDQLVMGRLGAAAWAWAGVCATALVVLCLAASIE